MGKQGMEKRIAGIVRWLERFQHAYRSGAIESALMDAECARADLETLRRDVWSALGSSRAPRRRWGAIACRAVLLALFVILATAVPVSVVRRDPVAGEAETSPAHDSLFAWTALRGLNAERGPVSAFEGSTHVGADVPRAAEGAAASRGNGSAGTRPAPRSGVVRRPSPGAAGEPGRKPAKAEKVEKKVPYEKIFSLLRTGERVLRNEEPAIEVERGHGKGENGL